MSQTFPDSIINTLQGDLPQTFDDLIHYFRVPDSSMKVSRLEEAAQRVDMESSIKSDTIVPRTPMDSPADIGHPRRNRRSLNRFPQSFSVQSEQQLETDVMKESSNMPSFVSKPVEIQVHSENLNQQKLQSLTEGAVPAVAKSRRTPKAKSKKSKSKTHSESKSADLREVSKPSKKRVSTSTASTTCKRRRSDPDAAAFDLKPLDTSSPGVKTTRSGRITMAPLQFWKSERIVSHSFEKQTVACLLSVDEPPVLSQLKSPKQSKSRTKRGAGELKLSPVNTAKRARK